MSWTEPLMLLLERIREQEINDSCAEDARSDQYLEERALGWLT
jgi:hypothetical protein